MTTRGSKKSNNSSRFSGPIGEEYRLFKESVPWHDDFQDSVQKALGEYTKNNPKEKGFTVMEAGCGTGYTTARILDTDDRIKIIAVDNEKKTLDQAKELFKDESQKIDFKQNDILSELKNTPNNSINSFVSAYTLHNIGIKEQKKIFAEIFRALKKSGIFINADKIARDDEDLHKQDLENQIRAFDVYDKMNLSQLKVDWTKHYREDEKNKITENEYTKILKELGFKNIKTTFRQGMEATITAEK